MYFHNFEAFEDWDAHISALKQKLGSLNHDVITAIEIVREHHNQPRTITKGNYNRHPLRVARIIVEDMSIHDVDSILIALCHDLGEWTNYNIENLKNEFSDTVYSGVQILTWDQIGSWSDFVDSIVGTGIKNLIGIKIADKLDNNRAIALSGSSDEKSKTKDKTINTVLPLVEEYYPRMTNSYAEVLSRLI